MILNFELFESSNSEKDLSSKMEDLMVLQDIFMDIEDDCIDSHYYYISPVINKMATYHGLNGRKIKTMNISFSDGWRIDLSFPWKSKDEFQNTIVTIIKRIMRCKMDGFRFIYNHIGTKSTIDIKGSYIYFDDIFKKFISPDGNLINNIKLRGISSITTGHLKKYKIILYFKKNS